MVAIIHQMADREDWMPGAELQAVCEELSETKEWLVAVQKKRAPPSPHPKMPMRQELMSPPNSQRGESEVGNQGDKVRNKADAGDRKSVV